MMVRQGRQSELNIVAENGVSPKCVCVKSEIVFFVLDGSVISLLCSGLIDV